MKCGDIIENFDVESYRKFLFSNQDIAYKKFHSKLVETKYEIIGIRTGILRNIAKDISKTCYKEFLKNQDFKYYEEVNIYGFVLALVKEELFNKYFWNYIAFIDNWATCDSFCSSLKGFKKNKEKFYPLVLNLLEHDKEYYLRAGLVILLMHYVCEEYLVDIFNIICKIKSDKYYVNMAIAWLICECFTKYSDETIKFLDNTCLDKFVINKAISKIRDSYRVSKENKQLVLKYRI